MPKTVILIRAIGGATHKRLTMKALESACLDGGLARVRNLLATGNLIVEDRRTPNGVAAVVARILGRAGLENEVFARSAESFLACASTVAFPEAMQTRPQWVQLVALESRPDDAGLAALRARATHEGIERAGDEIVVDYGGSILGSALTPVLVERLLKRRSTARNWNTVQKIARLLT
jgi:uncharacterized protein (DUF1697 family)